MRILKRFLVIDGPRKAIGFIIRGSIDGLYKKW